MRIVYDDAKQPELVKAVEKFMDALDVKRFVLPEWGTYRVQMHELRKNLDVFLSSYNMSIGNTVIHAHGIGNNCQYPVYYHPEGVDELQQCGSISLNRGVVWRGLCEL